MKRVSIGLGFDVSLLSAPGRLARGLDVCVFPELLDGGYAAIAAGRGRHREGDAFLTQAQSLSARGSMAVVAGSVLLEGRGGRATNSTLVFWRGKRIHRYDKIHLFRPAGDHRFFEGGDGFGVFSFRAGGVTVRAGVIICYDLRFPELIRALARRGIEILFVPARWPRSRDAAWRTLLRARAIENQIIVIGCNARGREGGYSYAFDPFGGEVFSGRKAGGGQMHRFTVDLELIRRAHRHHRNIAEARLLREIRYPRRLRRVVVRSGGIRSNR